MRWDVFIAYHGTYDENGTCKKAEELFDFLTDNGIRCYFFPKMPGAKFGDTPKKVGDCSYFLLVANGNIGLKLQDGKLMETDPVYAEMDAFYDIHIASDRTQCDRIRVYATDGFCDQKAGLLYPAATCGVEHFDTARDGEENSKIKLLSWLKGEVVTDMKGSTNQNENPLKYHNLDLMPSCDQEIVCREKEIDDLFNMICGWDGVRARRNRKHTVCISAYGGIGKTVLVVEFIERLLNKLKSEEYKGFRPEFILFYSAKTGKLDYEPYSGDLKVMKMSQQINGFDMLIDNFYRDLKIDKNDNDWDIPGILVVDNLETFSKEDRENFIRFVVDDLPPSVGVIITTRIPVGNEADADIALSGFPNEAGKVFIQRYCEKNGMDVRLTEHEQLNLLKYSMGNTLVLVLALKRIAAGKSTVRSVLEELRRLPNNDKSNAISEFMYQNTIEELMNSYPELESQIREILDFFVTANSLTIDIIADAAGEDLTYGEIHRVINILSNYLVVERRNDIYTLNEYARNYVLLNSPVDPQRQQRIKDALSRANANRRSLDDIRRQYQTVDEVINEWCGDSENEKIVVAKAFVMYEEKKLFHGGNIEYNIDQLRIQFEELLTRFTAHPYVYYQYARILNELRNDKFIDDRYVDKTRQCFEQCFILLNKPEFEHIKSTKSFSSVQWIFAQFLLGIKDWRKALYYAEQSEKNFSLIGLDDDEIAKYHCHARVLVGIAKMGLFEEDILGNKAYLKEAKCILSDLEKVRGKRQGYIAKSLDELRCMIKKFQFFS